MTQIAKFLNQQVQNFALAFDAAIGLEEAGGASLRVAGEDVGTDDEVGDAGFVFEGDEDHAAGGAGALADQDQSGDAHPSVVFVDQFCGGDDFSAG